MKKKRNRKRFAAEANQRCRIYGLLSAIFYQEPNESFINTFLNSRSIDFLLTMGEMDDENFWSRSSREICEDLSVEYTRLFLGPKNHIPPFESLYNFKEGETRQIWGSVAVEVKKIIESTGLSFKKDYGGIPDHIGIELEFMEKLVRKEAELWESRENNSFLLRNIELEEKFINEHLAMWIPEFCFRVIKAAKLAFYRNFAEITKDFIEREKKEVKSLLSCFAD